MTDQVKVLIAERNGTDLEDSEELSLAAENIYLNSTSFPSDSNVKTALEGLAAGGGSGVHFSYKVVDFDLTIPEKEQMVIGQEIEIADGYELIVDGEVYIIA